MDFVVMRFILSRKIYPADQSSIWNTESDHLAVLYSFHPSTDHGKCKRVPNWISLKTGLKVEIGVTEYWELPEFWELNERTYRKVYFFMLSCLIFKSSVDRGIPSLAAAPFGPATFPLLSARAASMSSFS